MITILADLAAEDPVGPGGVAEDQRDQHDRAYEHEYLAAFRRGRLPDRDAARNDVRPHRDGEPDHRQGANDESDQDRRPSQDERGVGKKWVGTGECRRSADITILKEQLHTKQENEETQT